MAPSPLVSRILIGLGGDSKRLRSQEDAGGSYKRSRPDQDENAGQGPDQADERQKKEVSPPKEGIKVEGVGVFKWYHIEHAGGRKHKCLCKGNCNLACLGHTKGCPNPAVVNLHVSKLARKATKPKPLCAPCKCQTDGCMTNARKPFTKDLVVKN